MLVDTCICHAAGDTCNIVQGVASGAQCRGVQKSVVLECQ